MLTLAAPRRVAIVGGTRIPFARSHGAYAGQGNQDLLTAALRESAWWPPGSRAPPGAGLVA